MLLVTPLSGSEIRSRMIFIMVLLYSGSCPLLEAAQCETSSGIFSQVPISFPIRNLLDPSSQMSKKQPTCTAEVIGTEATGSLFTEGHG